MIFWDSSALIPLLVAEPESSRVRELARRDPALVVWWASPLECASALARQTREGCLSHADADAARGVLSVLQASWIEVLASDEVRGWAERLLLRHPLRAALGLQLGAALTWARGKPRDHLFATFDTKLQTAARAEGFHLAL